MAIVCDNTKKTEYDLVIWEKSLIFACDKQIEVLQYILQSSKINFHIKYIDNYAKKVFCNVINNITVFPFNARRGSNNK